MQSDLMELEICNEGDYFIDKVEKIAGKYGQKIVNNLNTYLIIYVNRLIHGLMKISLNFHNHFDLSKSAWPYPPNLLSFTLSDLFRCKFISK